MDTKKISVCILVKNAQNTLAQCLESLREFGEIVLLDNNSTDKTLQIAQEFNTAYKNLRIEKSEFIGFGALKNLCVSYAKNEWILSIDSDEVLENEALSEIKALDLKQNFVVALGRKNLYDGEWIKACGWYPDFVWRIFNKNFTGFNDNFVHESVKIPQNAEKIYLKNALKHYAFNDIESIITKMNRYTSFSAQEKFKKGKKASFLGAILRFHLTFFRDYFLRKGFLYGYKGFIVALLNAEGAFYRYAKLYELQKDKEPKVIAFDRRLGVGDIISSIPAFYLAKKLYPQAKFILITNKIGANLCQNFDFIDKIIVEKVDFEAKDFAKIIDENAVDTLLLGHRTSKIIKLAKQSKCPNKIISWRHLHSLFSSRFKHPKHIKRLQRLEILRCLDLVQMIEPKKCTQNAEFNFATLPVRLQTSPKNKAFVDEFFKQVKKPYATIIGISPFGISSANYNLAINDWIELVRNLAQKFSKTLFVFMNFKGSGYEFAPFSEENIKVFTNDDDLLNLVELTSRLNLCISLSTGNIHIADNLGIDTLGFFARTDEKLFACGQYGGHFEALFLPKEWQKDYEFYKNAFFQKATKCVQNITKQKDTQ